MAKQLTLLAPGQIVPTALHTEMQQSYLEYAMSVIVGRALPDVQDGLKPVHRRILYAMHELGLTPDRPYRKCARVVGDVLGKYHPHGDQAVYDALVRLVQDFSTRYPLLAGHGNFGSIDNDPPAAMRYTETRLAAISHEALLSEIGEATVDFIPNFDNSQQEPVVLPAQLPFLLLNGSSGIAVGMATNVPPHNLAELVDGLIALIDRPSLPDAELFQLIPAPDFPTGGEIVSLTGVWDAYRTGRGSIVVRGVTSLEQVQSAKGRRRDAIVVSELPYQVNKASWIEKVAELVNQGKIEGIADIRDESDRDGMRVVIDLKRESNPDQILEKLYKLTALQSTFGAIFLALVDGVPRQLSLRESLQAFLSFRETTLNRRYRHEHDQASDRLHIVEGLLTALDNLDAVIDLLRQAPDGSTAEAQLQSRFNLSEQQASAILGMPLRRLTGLERQKLYTERDELHQRMQELDKLLNDRRELLKAMKKDLRTLKRKYGDPRRTRIPQGEAATYQEPPSKEPSPKGQEPATSTQEPTPTPMTPTHEGTSQAVATDISTTDATSSTVSVSPIAVPPTPEPVPSTSDVNDVLWECSIEPRQPAQVSTPPSPPLESPPASLFALDVEPETILEFTQRGYVRRWSPKLYEQIHRSPALVDDRAVVFPIVPELNPSPPDDWVIQTQLVNTQGTLWVVVSDGKLYPLSVSTVPLVSAASSRGRSLLTLLPGSAATADNTVVFSVVPSTVADSPQPDLVLVSHQGRIKRIPLTEVAEVSSRGLMVIKLREDDRLAYATLLQPHEHIILATSTGRILHLTNSDLPAVSRTAQSQPALRLRPEEQLVGCVAVPLIAKVLLLSCQGYAKSLSVEAIRPTRLGGLGMQGFQFASRTDRLCRLLPIRDTYYLVVTTDHNRNARLPVAAIAALQSETPILQLLAGEQPVDVALVQSIT